MMSIDVLVGVADGYKDAASVPEDSTVSYRVFRDSKLLSKLRAGEADLTTGRFNRAMQWFAAHWPKGHAPHGALQDFAVTPSEDAA